MENLFQIIEALGNEVKKTQDLANKPSDSKPQSSFLDNFEKQSSNIDNSKIKRLEETVNQLEKENLKLKENKEILKIKIENLKTTLEKIK